MDDTQGGHTIGCSRDLPDPRRYQTKAALFGGVRTTFGVESFPLGANQIEASNEPQMPETTYEDMVMVMIMIVWLFA